MKLKDGLVTARGSIVMIAALLTGLTAVVLLERWQPTRRALVLEATSDIPTALPRPLTAEEREGARVAWRYFERNVRLETGLADSVDQYPAATLWDTGSYLMALISAERLSIIQADEFDARMSRALVSLAALPLFEGRAPNKSYNTVTLAMVDYNNQPTATGIGWSAIDIGRMLVPLHILVWRYPHHTGEVRAVLDRWQWQMIVRDGVLFGAAAESGATKYLQEGRLGYEEYSAKSYSLAGLDVQDALRIDDFLAFVNVSGIDVATDTRSPEEYGGENQIVSEPYILDGLEFGFDRASRELAWRVLQAQQARFVQTGLLTAVSEDNIDTAPYFVYNTVFTSGKPWNAVAPDGSDASAFKTLSTKAAIGWDAIYQNAYTKQLSARVSSLMDRNRGWYSGIYDRDGRTNTAITANTNAIVLESLCYIQFGPLLKAY
jgi:hypothetical protein